jgi:iron complex transport system ATP-binding protein
LIIETKSLAFSYNKKPVLDGIDIGIRKGEIIGILGPNGCGKTTFLKHLNKNLTPEDGCVMLEDVDISGILKKELAKSIAVVPQGNEIRFAFTVRDIVSMGRMPFQDAFQGNSSDDIDLVDDAMRCTGIFDFADRYVNTMSGGERQRVIIARAIAQTPKIILMDEPTLHLDINMQFDILDLMKKLSKERGMTVVIVSHDLPMVARYCDRIVLLRNHKVYAIGTPEEVLTSENMCTIFNVDASLETDPVSGENTVRLYGSHKQDRS